MTPGRRKTWFSWKRAAVAALTLVAVVLIFRRIDGKTLLVALGQMHPGWFLLALGIYGAAFLIAGWRWHLILKLTGCGVNLSAAVRLSFIGHYFFIVLFGGVQGDIAKCSVYSRWYGYSFPEVFATSPLDRLLGLSGLIAFGGMAFGLAAWSGSLAQFGDLDVRSPGPWAGWVAAFVVVAAAGLMYFKPRGENMGSRMLRAIREGAGRLLMSPGVTAVGFVCGFAVQCFLSGVMALCLMAVSQSDLPWSHLLWTFPVISMLSALPVTFAGLGVREGAAIVLLGFYGVPESEAVAAALLSFAINLGWGGVGGYLLWRESNRFLAHAKRALPETLSVVIPTLNEAGSLSETVERVRKIPELLEVIVVDGGSEDETRAVAEGLGCRVLETNPGRGGQMRLGAAEAKGDVVVLLHADTWVPPGAGRAAIDCLRDRQAVGGGFWKVFRDPPALLLGSKFKCALRLYLSRRIAGDQGLFVRRDVLEEVGGVPDMVLMEEFRLCSNLRKTGRLVLADAIIVTSARRFAKLGVIRTYVRMWKVVACYWMGKSGPELQRIYDRGGRG